MERTYDTNRGLRGRKSSDDDTSYELASVGVANQGFENDQTSVGSPPLPLSPPPLPISITPEVESDIVSQPKTISYNMSWKGILGWTISLIFTFAIIIINQYRYKQNYLPTVKAFQLEQAKPDRSLFE